MTGHGSKDEAIQVSLMRPIEGTTLTPGDRINAVGWIDADRPVLGITISLGDHLLGSARVDITPEQVVALTGHRPGEKAVGFIFIGTVPDLPTGDVHLFLRAATVDSTHSHSIRLRIAESASTADPAVTGGGNEVQHAINAGGASIQAYLDTPRCLNSVATETIRGFLSISGWAFSDDGIDRVEVYVDDNLRGPAHHGTRREDVEDAFPGAGGLMSGFAMIVPPASMRDGEHQIRLCIVAKSGTHQNITFRIQYEKTLTGPGPWSLRTKLRASEVRLQNAILAAADCSPHWAIVIVVVDAGPVTLDALTQTLETLRWQAYARWSLVLVTAATQHAALEALVTSFDSVLAGRGRVVLAVPEDPLADLVGEATGIIVVRAGDQLGEDALLEHSLAIAVRPDADFLYSDERRVDPVDGVEKAFFKPAYSPDLLLSTDYIGRLWSASTTLIRSAGLHQSDLGLGNYHIVLTLAEHARGIVHIPKVLCRSPPRRLELQRDQVALRQALNRRQVKAELLPGAVQGTYQLRRDVGGGLVSIIIPTVASHGLVKVAIDSIRANTAWPDYEIIVVDNLPRNPNAEQRRWRAWIKTHADQTVAVPQPFNWSLLNNTGVGKANGEYLLFLNDDVEVRGRDWLRGLIEQAQRPEVGVVGPQLVYPDGFVQHAGVFLGRHGGRHAFRYCARDEPGPFGLALTQRNVIGVTGACMMMRREVFERLNGFNEHHAIINNDVDFCLRAHRAGFLNVYTPAVSLIHHEQVSRAALPDTYSSERFDADWSALFHQGDPFFSRHLSLESEDYAVEAEPVEASTTGHPVVARHQVRRILAVKVDHIGDFVTAMPAFRRLKTCFPNARLTVLVAKASLSLAKLEPAIDEVIEFNFFHARSERGLRQVSDRTLAKLRSQLAPRHFDLAVDLRRQPETRAILQSTGARWLAGFDHAHEHSWLDFSLEFEGDLSGKFKNTHISDALVGLVDVVSRQCEDDRRVIATALDRNAARTFAASLVDAANSIWLDSCLLVIVHPGAGGSTKQWPPRLFAGLIDLLVARSGVCVAVVGAADEVTLAGNVVALLTTQSRVFNLAGKTGLKQLPLLLKAADLFVGNDSGPKHIAAALGVPTVGVHSGAVDPTEWGATGPYAVNVRRNMVCSPCYLAHATDCHRSMACLAGLPVGDVYAACERLLVLGRKKLVESGALD